MEENLKEVYSADKMYKINIIQEVLEENNIKSVVLDQKGSAFLVGEIHLFVNEADEEKAKNIIVRHEI